MKSFTLILENVVTMSHDYWQERFQNLSSIFSSRNYHCVIAKLFHTVIMTKTLKCFVNRGANENERGEDQTVSSCLRSSVLFARIRSEDG